MTEHTNEPQIRVGRIRTEALKGGSDDKLYNLGGEKGLNLTALPFFRNGLPIKQAGLAIAVYALWSAPLFALGIGYMDFAKFGLVIHFGPPILFVRWIFKQIKDSSITAGQQAGFVLNRFFREHTHYRANSPAGYRGTTRIRFTMLTAPGATSLPKPDSFTSRDSPK